MYALPSKGVATVYLAPKGSNQVLAAVKERNIRFTNPISGDMSIECGHGVRVKKANQSHIRI